MNQVNDGPFYLPIKQVELNTGKGLIEKKKLLLQHDEHYKVSFWAFVLFAFVCFFHMRTATLADYVIALTSLELSMQKVNM